MRFVETTIFTKVVSAILDDESYRALQTPKQARILAELIREEFK